MSLGRDRSGRGQTSIDFLIGVTVFMLAVMFVFATIPGMIDPFSEGQEETLVVDRVATQLAESMLGEGDRTSRLNETCTIAFFEDESGTDCAIGFEKGDPLATKIGIDDRYRLNVTLERSVSGDPEPEILCTDGDTIITCAGSGSRLAVGSTPPTSVESVSRARRTVSVAGRDATLVVRLW